MATGTLATLRTANFCAPLIAAALYAVAIGAALHVEGFLRTCCTPPCTIFVFMPFAITGIMTAIPIFLAMSDYSGVI